MPIIFKIFLFLLLKQGASVLKNDEGATLCDNNSFSQSLSMLQTTMLNLQGDSSALEEAIAICEMYRPADVQRAFNANLPTGSTASVRFDQIADENRSQISKQLILRLTGKVWVEWKVRVE